MLQLSESERHSLQLEMSGNCMKKIKVHAVQPLKITNPCRISKEIRTCWKFHDKYSFTITDAFPENNDKF